MDHQEEDKNQYLNYSYTRFNDNDQRARTNSQSSQYQSIPRVQPPPQTQQPYGDLNPFRPQSSQHYHQEQQPYGVPPGMDMMKLMQQMQSMMSQFNMLQAAQQQKQHNPYYPPPYAGPPHVPPMSAYPQVPRTYQGMPLEYDPHTQMYQNKNISNSNKFSEQPKEQSRLNDRLEDQRRQERTINKQSYIDYHLNSRTDKAQKQSTRGQFRQQREYLSKPNTAHSSSNTSSANNDKFPLDYLPTEKSEQHNSGKKRELDSYLYEQKNLDHNPFANKKVEKGKYQQISNPFANKRDQQMKHQQVPNPFRVETTAPQTNIFTAKKPPPISFDDMPIRGKVPDTVPASSLSSSSPVNFHDRPIKPTANNSAYESKPSSSSQQPKPKINRNSKKNMFQELEEKPVKGLGKDLNEILDQFQQPNEDNQKKQQPESSRPRNFLKKGTRQYLSSAHSKMKPVKKDEDYYEQKSRIQVVNKSKKVQISKPTPKNKNSQPSNRFKIDTDDNDQLMFRNDTHTTSRNNKSPKPHHQPQQPSRSKQPAPSKTTKSYSSSVEQISDENKVELIRGVIVTLSEFDEIKEKYMMQDDTLREELEKVKKLKQKYEEMTKVLQKQRSELMEELNREKELFEEYKDEEMKKINNQRRVAERQKNAVCNQSYKKEKEELEVQKKEWEKQRDEIKKKEASNKHFIEKLKKEIEELKRQGSSVGGFGDVNRQSYEVGNSSTGTNNRRTTGNNFERESSRERKEDKVKPKFSYNINKEKQKEKEKQREREKEKDKFREIERQKYRESSQTSDKDQGKQSSFANKNKSQTGKSTSFINTSNPGTNSKPRNGQSSFSNHQQFDYEDIKFNNKSKDGLPKNQKPSTLSSNSKFKQIYQPPKPPSSQSQPQQQHQSRHSQQPSYQSQQQSPCDYQPYYPGMTIEDISTLPLNIKMVTQQMISNLFFYNKNSYYLNYLHQQKKSTRTVKSIQNDDPEKVVTIYTDGTREIIFETGVKKELFENGYSIIHFKNKDIKQKLPNGTVIYFFKDKNVEQISFVNQMEIYRFENNQIEFHYPDGLIEVRHEDGSIKIQPA